MIGFSGEGGPAIAAQLNQPWAMALDSTGNLFIADTVGPQVFSHWDYRHGSGREGLPSLSGQQGKH
jgi:hypothetical protein